MESFSLLNVFFIVAMAVAMVLKTKKRGMKKFPGILYDLNKEFSLKDIKDKYRNIKENSPKNQTGIIEEKPEILPGVKIIFLIGAAAFIFFFLYLLTK
jgi:hypothetical protein